MKLKKLPLAAFAFCGFFTAINPVFAQTWTQTSAPTNYGWTSVASSADGTKLVAVGYFSIYTSTNSGVTWISNAPSADWISVASSADGNKLVAAAGYYNGFIYTSTNAGATWLVTSAPDTNWVSVASSADGTKLVAAAGNGYTFNGITIPGLIYTSTNSGTSWTATSAPSTNWQTVASSADGTKLVAVVAGAVDGGIGSDGEPYGVETDGLIYTSTNAGATWQATSAVAFGWNSVASSADGSKLIAASWGGWLVSSTNSGATWATVNLPPNTNYFTCVASSADGSKLVAIANLVNCGGQGLIYISTNSGASWMDTSAPNQDFRSVACSPDGNKLVAAVNGGGIYTWKYYALTEPPIGYLNATGNGGTGICLDFLTQTNTIYYVQASSNLTTWTNFDGPFLGDGSLFIKTYPTTNQSNCFYRFSATSLESW